jgi:alpha-N-arabinofuranosidase
MKIVQRLIYFVGFLLIFGMSPAIVLAQQPAVSGNLITGPGFETAENGLPVGWVLDQANADKGKAELDSSSYFSGARSVRLSPNDKNTNKDNLFGLAQIISAERLVGMRLRLSVKMRTSDGAAAVAGTVAIGADNKMIGSPAMVIQTLPTPDFKSQEALFQVPANAKAIIVVASVSGTSGSAWFDEYTFAPVEIFEPDTKSKIMNATISVNAASVIRQIPKTLVGTNIEWIWDGNGLWDRATNSPKPQILKTTKELGLGSIRYPGGLFSDYYHWRDGVGPIANRPTVLHSPADKSTSQPSFGTDEFLSFCKMVGAEPLITVNIVTGTPLEAAEWVTYCNSEKPGRVKTWEIGNESYIKGDDELAKHSYMSVDEYAKRYMEWSEAMRKADPSIKIGAISGVNFGKYNLLNESDWNAKLLAKAGPAIDFIAVHNGYAPVNAGTSGASFYEVYSTMLAFPLLVDRNLKELDRQIKTYAPDSSKRIKIAVTEWAPLFDVLPLQPYIGHCKTLGSGLYAADMMRVLVSCPRLEIADSFKMTENSFMGWIMETGVPKPSYYALQMYSRHFGNTLVSSTSTSPTFNTSAVGMADGVKGAPYLEVVSSLSADKSKLFVIVINKHFSASMKTKISVKGFIPKPAGKAWVLTGPSLDANNGNDLIQWPGIVWAEQAQAPVNPAFKTGKPGTVVTKQTPLKGAGKSFTYTFPPMSVTSLEMVRGK